MHSFIFIDIFCIYVSFSQKISFLIPAKNTTISSQTVTTILYLFKDKILIKLEQCSISERDMLYRIIDYALQLKELKE